METQNYSQSQPKEIKVLVLKARNKQYVGKTFVLQPTGETFNSYKYVTLSIKGVEYSGGYDTKNNQVWLSKVGSERHSLTHFDEVELVED